MKIELYVVQPYKDITYLTFQEKTAIEQLEALKVKLCQAFGGLTESAPCKGYWQNNGKLVHDVVTVWTIYSSTEEADLQYAIKDIITHYAKKVQEICKQEVQLCVIDNKPYFLN